MMRKHNRVPWEIVQQLPLEALDREGRLMKHEMTIYHLRRSLGRPMDESDWAVYNRWIKPHEPYEPPMWMQWVLILSGIALVFGVPLVLAAMNGEFS